MITKWFTALFFLFPGILFPAAAGLSATSEKTKDLLKKYPKTEINAIETESSCSGIFVLDSCFYYNWSAGDSAWNPAQGSFYSYDLSGRITDTETRYPYQGSWVNGRWTQYVYDDQGLLINQLLLSYNYSSHSWDTVNRYLRTYSVEGHLLQTKVQDYSGGTWTNRTLYTYDYDEAGRRVLYQVSNPEGTEWIPQYRFVYAWEEDLKTGYVKQDYDTVSGRWENDYRIDYFYDTQGHLSTEMNSPWDTLSETWVNRSLITYAYDDRGRITLKLYQSWVSGAWHDAVRYLYTYERSDTTEILFQVWYNTDSLWHDDYRYFYGFDPCGNLTSETGQEWGSSSGRWINDYLVLNYISPLQTGNPLRIEILDSGNISCYGAHDGWALAGATGGTPPYTWLWDNDPPSTDSVATGLAPWRWYHVTVSDAVGNTATDSVMLTEPEPVSTGTIHGPQRVCLNRYYCYCVKPPQDGYYIWTAIGGEIPGYPTGPHATVRWTRPGSDTLAVVYVNINGCRGDTAILVVNTLTVTSPLLEKNALRIWPNPADEILHVSVPDRRSYTYSITTLSGRRLVTGKTGEGPETVIPVSALAPGIYILELRIQNSRIVRKITIR